MNQNNQLKKAQESLNCVIKQLTIQYHHSLDKEATQAILECFIELNHIDCILEDIQENQKIPFFVKRGGIA